MDYHNHTTPLAPFILIPFIALLLLLVIVVPFFILPLFIDAIGHLVCVLSFYSLWLRVSLKSVGKN
ncbi:hypothetical protein HMPREF3192_01164 [Atopobium deltae]|uniref:Transmembrane protein n=1 Tax=Atopobium deltae TaxID=1393034 RepID=A0A133XSL1_9ACTN|nr:hypothetical protein HMPREF3192_01164 [Atopobium deltae]